MAAPALFVAIPLLFGVLVGTSRGGVTPHAVAALVVCWLAALACVLRRASAPGTIGTAAGCVFAGIVIGGHAQSRAEHSSLAAWHAARGADRPAHLTGVLREDATATAAGVSLTLNTISADGSGVDGGVRLTVGGALAPAVARTWRAGRTLALDALLREPLDYRDPGVPSDRQRLARQGIVLVGTVKSAALVTLERKGSPASEAAAALRAWVRYRTEDAVGRWSAASAGVVTAILIGDRSGLAAEDERRLQEAGTYHVIAISGGNIALLTVLLVAAGRAARLPARPTALAAIGVLAFYGYAAGMAPSVLRATAAGMLYLAARAADHRGAALNAIGVAAGLAAAAAPLSVLDPGFALSFGATFAIVVAVPRLGFVPRRIRRARRASRLARSGTALARAAFALGAATLCAEIALAPAGARLFGRVSIAGLLLNFAAIPLMSIIQVAGLAAVALDAVSPAAGRGIGWIAHAGTVGLLRSATIVDAAPWLVRDMPPPAWWTVACWYAGWTAILLPAGRRVRLAAVALVLAAAVPSIVRLPIARATLVAPPPPGWTRVAILDVGQGDATFVQPAGAAPLLVDAGGVAGTSFDLGRRVTLPALWAFGARSLGALVLSHGDPDHIGGAPAVLRALAPSEVWDGVPVPRHLPLLQLHTAAARAGIPWIARRAGEELAAGALKLRVLNPPPPDWERQRVRNDDSIVLEARLGGVAILLPGDITQAIEPAVLARVAPAPLVIVNAPHHGSAGSSSAPFVDALHPAAVIFSAGRRNPFGHPAPSIVARYRAAGAHVFSTAEDGAVVIDTDGEQVVVWCPGTGRREVFAIRRN